MATGPPNYKIVLCGEYGVGKSSIFRRFMNDTFTTETRRESTRGLDKFTRTYDIDGKDIRLTLWDTGGMEILSFLGSGYYHGAHAALLCYNVQNKETFASLSQSIIDILTNAEKAKIFLCGNMADNHNQDNEREVTKVDIDQFESDWEDLLQGIYTISCKENIGVEEMFRDIANVLYELNGSRQNKLLNLDVMEDKQTIERCCC